MDINGVCMKGHKMVRQILDRLNYPRDGKNFKLPPT